ncbi:hypothetical protein PS903_02131 [Pseudomonas fluorescens]|nr:hypothetical protein PS903_02131 [Pseudomonas fluorescens]
MSNLDKQITSAIKVLIRRNGGEIHGFWPDIADKIACEINGEPDGFIVKKYEEHLRSMGLKYLLENHPDIDYMRDRITGELNFVDRKLVYTACEVTVYKEPGCEPVIEWRNGHHG